MLIRGRYGSCWSWGKVWFGGSASDAGFPAITGTVLFALDIDNLLLRSNYFHSDEARATFSSAVAWGADDSLYTAAGHVDINKAKKLSLGGNPNKVKEYLNAIIKENRKRGLKTRFVCVTAKGGRDCLVDIAEVELFGFLGKSHDKPVEENADLKGDRTKYQVARVANNKARKESKIPEDDTDTYLQSLYKSKGDAADTSHPLGYLYPSNHPEVTIGNNDIPRVCVMQAIASATVSADTVVTPYNLNTIAYRLMKYIKDNSAAYDAKESNEKNKFVLSFLDTNGIPKKYHSYILWLCKKNDPSITEKGRRPGIAHPHRWLTKGDVIVELVTFHNDGLSKGHPDFIVESHLADDGVQNCDAANVCEVNAHCLSENAFFHKTGDKRPDGTLYARDNIPNAVLQTAYVKEFWGSCVARLKALGAANKHYLEFPVKHSMMALSVVLKKEVAAYCRVNEARKGVVKKTSYLFFGTVKTSSRSRKTVSLKNNKRAQQAAFLDRIFPLNTLSADAKMGALYLVKNEIAGEHWFNGSQLLEKINRLLECYEEYTHELYTRAPSSDGGDCGVYFMQKLYDEHYAPDACSVPRTKDWDAKSALSAALPVPSSAPRPR
jgi:hypothetical protein